MKTAEEYLEIALGGNMNLSTLKPLAWHEIMTDYAKYYHKEMGAVSSGAANVSHDCHKCEKAKMAIQKMRTVIEAGNLKVNELWAQITIGDAIELFKEVLEEKKSG